MMKMIKLLKNRLHALGLCALLFAPAAQAQMSALRDAELSGVWGQAMVSISNSSLNGLDF